MTNCPPSSLIPPSLSEMSGARQTNLESLAAALLNARLHAILLKEYRLVYLIDTSISEMDGLYPPTEWSDYVLAKSL